MRLPCRKYLHILYFTREYSRYVYQILPYFGSRQNGNYSEDCIHQLYNLMYTQTLPLLYSTPLNPHSGRFRSPRRNGPHLIAIHILYMQCINNSYAYFSRRSSLPMHCTSSRLARICECSCARALQPPRTYRNGFLVFCIRYFNMLAVLS